MVRIGVDVEGFIVGLSVGVVGSVLEVYGHVQEVADFEVCANSNVQSLFLEFTCDVFSCPFRLWSACIS